MGTFSDLNIAVSALQAQQYAISVTGQNIANANTQGYHRQEAIFVSSQPETGTIIGGGIGNPVLGTGVLIEKVQRAQTDFVDGQVRTTNSENGSWDAKNNTLQQVEPALQEPGDSGISTILNNFWSSWQQLSASPDSEPSRVAVASAGQNLAQSINTLYGNLRSLQTEADNNVASSAGDINQKAKQIAGLNEQITASTAGGYQPNDLIDQRDQLVEDLSKIAGVNVYGTAGSDMIISIGGKALVQGDQVNAVKITQDANGRSQISWSDDSSAVNITGGEVKGLMDARDTLLGGYIGSLNQIASSIITKVNAVHSTGTTMSGATAGDFFSGTDASNIAVNPTLLSDPTQISAAQDGTTGDNSVAAAIAGIKTATDTNGQTIGDVYGAFVSTIGADSKDASSQLAVSNASLAQLQTQRESISGVSMDEEMSNMVKFQQGYNSAARIFSTMNDMMDTLINKMGVN